MVTSGRERAKRYGFELEEHVLQFLQCMLLLDSDLEQATTSEVAYVLDTLTVPNKPPERRIARALTIAKRIAEQTPLPPPAPLAPPPPPPPPPPEEASAADASAAAPPAPSSASSSRTAPLPDMSGARARRSLRLCRPPQSHAGIFLGDSRHFRRVERRPRQRHHDG